MGVITIAIDAKINLLGQIERKCAEHLTVVDMEKIMRAIADVLDDFDVTEQILSMQQKDDMLDIYLSTMKIQGRSELTIKRYKDIIGKFYKGVNASARQVNVYHIRNWLAAEKERGIQDSTLEGERMILSSYFGWLYRESLIERNPMANVGTIKVPKKHKKIVTDIEFEKLNQGCTNVRDRAILHFLASTGCRISEVTSLNRDMVDLKSLECVVHGKGNKERRVYLDPVTGMLVTTYLASRTDDLEAFFVGKRGERLSPGGIRDMLKRLAERCGVEHIHPHKFRRTLATELARHGMPIQEVASILGHEKLDTTMEYVNIDGDSVKASYRKFA